MISDEVKKNGSNDSQIGQVIVHSCMMLPFRIHKMLFIRLPFRMIALAGIYLLICCAAIVPHASAQAYKVSTEDKKAIKYYYEAKAFAKRAQFKEAKELFKAAIERDPNFYEAFYGIGSCEEKLGNAASARKYYKAGLEVDENDSPNIHYTTGTLYYDIGNYDAAVFHIKKYIDWKMASESKLNNARKILKSCQFALEKMKTPLNFVPVKLDKPFNQFATQYFPVLTVDQEQLIYTMRRGTSLLDDEDIYYSRFQNGQWSAPLSLSSNINTDQNQGANAISADGRTLIFTSCNSRDGLGSCDLYISEKIGNRWSKPKNLGSNVNSRSWDSTPTLSSDGRTIYFASNRAGGFGNRDIWKSEQDEYGEWKKAENLGEEVNTQGEETSPFIHVNDQTLFFSSTAYLGFGGFDFYKTTKSDGHWTTPVNLGYPLNDHEDQISFFMTGDGKLGYFSKEVGDVYSSKSSIFKFKVPSEISVKNASTFLKGIVRDKETDEPLRAQIELYDLNKEKLISRFYSDEVTGEYLTVLTKGGQYGLYIKKKGYLFEDISFDLINQVLDKPLQKNIYLRPVKVGEKVKLNNLFFAFDKYELDDKSKVELKEIYKFLWANPRTVIEVQAHTDNVGSNDYNQGLSDKRAKAVYDYLLGQKIPARLLTYKGYGSTNPVASNDNEEGRRLNRRVEFEVIK